MRQLNSVRQSQPEHHRLNSVYILREELLRRDFGSLVGPTSLQNRAPVATSLAAAQLKRILLPGWFEQADSYWNANSPLSATTILEVTGSCRYDQILWTSDQRGPVPDYHHWQVTLGC